MRTSLSELKTTEDFILGRLSPADAFVFRARLIIDPQLRENVAALKIAYSLISAYGRKKLKAEIASVQEKIFSDPSKIEFQKHIHQLFSKPD